MSIDQKIHRLSREKHLRLAVAARLIRVFPLNQSSPIAAILICLLVGGYCFSAVCYAQESTPTPCPAVTEDPGATTAAAGELVKQLGSNDPNLRDKAATALEAMGKKAAEALAKHITNHLKPKPTDIAGTTKAITILAKIGNDVADDEKVRAALKCAAKQPETEGPVFQLRLAAIDALGEINRYKGSILSKETPTPSASFDSKKESDSDDLKKAKDAVGDLAKTARAIFTDAAVRVSLPPTPTPTPSLDADFRKSLLDMHDLQAELVKLAGQVNAAASPPKKKAADSDFPKLSDEKALTESLKKIEVGYLNATTTKTDKGLELKKAKDKDVRQFRTEAAYDLLTETKQLKDQLQGLDDGFSDLTKNRGGLSEVVSTLRGILSDLNKIVVADFTIIPKDSSPYALSRAVGTALNAIYSKPPKKKKADTAAKKGDAKNDVAKTDGDKKQNEKNAADKKESDSKNSEKSDDDEEHATDNE